MIMYQYLFAIHAQSINLFFEKGSISLTNSYAKIDQFLCYKLNQ